MGTLERLTFLTGTLLRSCCFQAERFVRHYLAAFWSWIVLVESSRFLTSSYYEGVVEAGYFTFYRRLSSGYSGPHCSSLSFFFFSLSACFHSLAKGRDWKIMFYCTLQTHIPVTTKNVLRSSSLNLFLAKHW